MQLAPVSVIIPTYNSAAYLGEAIDSALAQALPPRQIIVVDDGSTDQTPQLIQRYASRVQYVRQTNQGVSAARNRGLELANQPLVAFLDADDVWHPLKLKVQIAAMNAIPSLVLLGTRSFDWPARSMPRSRGCPAVGHVSWRQLVVKNRLVTSSVVVRRDAIEKAGIFDTSLQGPEDRDMWLRLARLGGVANLDQPLTGYREVHGSVSKQAARCHTSMRRIIQKLDETGQLRGQWLLRRKALSQIDNSVACIWSSAGETRNALKLLVRSLLLYPLPYRGSEVDASFERSRRLAVYLLRLLHLKSCPTLSNSSAVPAQNALGRHSGEALYV
jgi:hypothetical protein